jgi:hypothetical protein
MSGRRLALVIATGRYNDERLQRLRSPGSDARKLAGLLSDPHVGGFETTILLNRKASTLMRAIEEFYRSATRDDLVLTHVACHGIKDEDGSLYFAGCDTELRYLESTVLPRNSSIDRSNAAVVSEKCCYSIAVTAVRFPVASPHAETVRST